MYAEPSINDLEKETQGIIQDEDEFLKRYPFLSQIGTMSQQETEQEGIRLMDLMMDSFHQTNPKMKFKEMSPQEKVEQGLKFVDLIKKRYLAIQQQKQIFEKIVQPVEQLNQAKKQLQQAKEQLQPIQAQCKLICNQSNHLNFEINNLMINVFRNVSQNKH